MKKKKLNWLLSIVVILVMLIGAYGTKLLGDGGQMQYSDSVMDVPAFSGDPYVVINENVPEFEEGDYTTDSYEYFSALDSLGRCGYVMACVGTDLMPTEDRESISHIKPSGWVQAQYDIVDGGSLYNRCHLLGFQLTGENANECNLITGTRYMNVEGMLPFENLIADYVKETGNHVLYRVTPVYDGSNLVARGVQLEALSMEDNGEGVFFHVYVYNNQPGITIDYSDGTSRLEGTTAGTTTAVDAAYVLNTSSMKFHLDTCAQADSIRQSNRDTFTGDRQALINQGYVPAGCCNP